jgi:hypothetical protein
MWQTRIGIASGCGTIRIRAFQIIASHGLMAQIRHAFVPLGVKIASRAYHNHVKFVRQLIESPNVFLRHVLTLL